MQLFQSTSKYKGSGKMFTNFRKNEYFTKRAREYNPHIDHVAFCGMDDSYGRVYRSHNEVEKYRIYIDADKLLCPIQVWHTFYHELGHIECFHMGYKYHNASLSRQVRENEANAWAFKEMGMVDSIGRINEQYRLCYECITGFYASGEFIITTKGRCLEGLHLNCVGKKAKWGQKNQA